MSVNFEHQDAVENALREIVDVTEKRKISIFTEHKGETIISVVFVCADEKEEKFVLSQKDKIFECLNNFGYKSAFVDNPDSAPNNNVYLELYLMG